MEKYAFVFYIILYVKNSTPRYLNSEQKVFEAANFSEVLRKVHAEQDVLSKACTAEYSDIEGFEGIAVMVNSFKEILGK
jgi:hypothetical protein